MKLTLRTEGFDTLGVATRAWADNMNGAWVEKVTYEVADEADRLYRQTVESYPRFSSVDFYPYLDIEQGHYQLSLGTYNDLWNILDRGSPPHTIAARNAPTLAFFAEGYRRGTIPGRIKSGQPRKATANFRTPTVVEHPGFRGAMWSPSILNLVHAFAVKRADHWTAYYMKLWARQNR